MPEILSRYFKVLLEPGVELEKVNRKCRFSWWSDEPPKLEEKLDQIVQKVSGVLEIPLLMFSSNLRIFKDQEAVNAYHKQLHGGMPTHAKAVYVHASNTICASEKDISKDVLVHEMGHALAFHFFQKRPPRAIDELIAMYADEKI